MWPELAGSAPEAAQRLLGCLLERELDGRTLRVMINEVEAYDQTDPASHSFKGQTTRNASMFKPAGHLYIYLAYGLHHCCNIVCGPAGQGSAILIRSVTVLEGGDIMAANRPAGTKATQLTNGPGKLCQALQIDRLLDGHDLKRAPLRLLLRPPIPSDQIQRTPRIGISRAIDTLWRFTVMIN